jgi:hypothetical protein
MWRNWLKARGRLRLSTLILLIIIFGMAVTLILQQRREARLRSALRSARNANEEAIRVALNQPLDLKLIPKLTLALLLTEIKRVTRNGVLWDVIPFFVDPIGMQEAERSMNSPVTVSSQSVPIKEALDEALSQLKLDYVVRDGFLWITSKESIDKPLEGIRPSD